MQEVLGIAHCLACKFRKFSNNERVALPRGKHVGALPLTPVCRASKTKTNVSYVLESTWKDHVAKKSAIPFTIDSRKNYEIFHERAKKKSIFQKSSV